MIGEKISNIKKAPEKIKNGIKETKRAFEEKTVTLILGGFGLVAALAWNEAIKSLFAVFFNPKGELLGKFIYAIIVTLIVVIASSKLQRREENNK